MSNPESIWRFQYEFNGNRNDVRACGSIIYADSRDDILKLSDLTGLEVRSYEGELSLDFQLREDSETLQVILDYIKDLYSLDLRSSCLVSNDQRYFFRIIKNRNVPTKLIEGSEFLQLRAKSFKIGTHVYATEEESSKELYAVENDHCQRTKVDFGFISPFPALGISSNLKGKLESRSIGGLQFSHIRVGHKTPKPKKPLFKLESEVILPRSLTPYINKHGHPKKPHDDWSGKWESAYYHDEGYSPYFLRYSAHDLKKLPYFDIALTAEKTGNGPMIAFRDIVVSQRFRKVLQELKVRNVEYTPIILETS